MAEEHPEIRSINWREVFPWTHLFRGFRMAIDPKKLMLLFAALVGVWFTGKAMDVVWGRRVMVAVAGDVPGGDPKDIFRGSRGLPVEPTAVASDQFVLTLLPPPPAPGQPAAKAPGLEAYRRGRKGAEKDRERRLLGWVMYLQLTKDEKDAGKTRENAEKLVKDNSVGYVVGQLQAEVAKLYTKAGEEAAEAVKKAGEEHDRLKKALEQLAADPKETYDQRKKAAEDGIEKWEKGGLQRAKDWQNFDLGASYDRVIAHLDLLRGERISVVFSEQISRYFQTGIEGVKNFSPSGVLWSIQAVIVTPLWLFHDHWVYALIFLPAILVFVSFFGGAAARIAAVQFARDEKISLKEALQFAWRKKLSFIVSPLIPGVIIFVIVLVTALVSLVMNIPVGELLAAATLWLALIGGLIMALVLVGTVAGAGLMHPTIAVEGSDAFDAISRSFSYIYSRPWTAGFYAVITIGYGAITYAFVRFFVWLMLFMTHFAVGLGVFAKRPIDQPVDSPRLMSKLEAMWATPGYDNLYSRHPEFMNLPTENLTSYAIGLYVYIVLFAMAAYVLSYFYSSLTIIYYLLRNHVDATDLDDVYLEEPEEEFTEMTTAAPKDGAATAAPAGEAPKPKVDLPMAGGAAPTPAAGDAKPPEPAAPAPPPATPPADAKPADPPAGGTPPAGDAKPPEAPKT
jgi:hypothetical protein